jgi:hypothetical protein
MLDGHRKEEIKRSGIKHDIIVKPEQEIWT